MKLYNKIFEAGDLGFRKSAPSSRSDQVKASMDEWENQEEINRDFRDLVAQELDNPVNIKFDGDGNKYIDLNHLSGEAFKCTDFSDMFNYTWEAQARMTDVDISEWDVSRGKNFINMFKYYRSFNCDLSKWDVSHGEDFDGMFYGCYDFNSDLSKWDVSRGQDFRGMFQGCHNFNSDLSKWDVSQGGNFREMFENCRNFNSDLSNWNILDNAMTFRMFWDCPIEENFKPKRLQNI